MDRLLGLYDARGYCPGCSDSPSPYGVVRGACCTTCSGEGIVKA